MSVSRQQPAQGVEGDAGALDAVVAQAPGDADKGLAVVQPQFAQPGRQRQAQRPPDVGLQGKAQPLQCAGLALQQGRPQRRRCGGDGPDRDHTMLHRAMMEHLEVA